MFAYLAHPIDLAGESSWLGSMLADLSGLLKSAHIGAYRPAKAYLADTADQGHCRFVNDMNNIAIHQADVFVAVLSRDIPTWGTPVEIGFALSMRKPTVIFTDSVGSVQLAAWSESGAVIIDMSDPDVVWPTGPDLLALFELSATLQEEKPCQQLRVIESTLVTSAPLLVSGEAANLRPGKYRGDAGIDLAISHAVTLEPGEYRFLSTGVHVAIPDGFFGWVTGRSSTWRDFRCSVVTGIIDSGYRGELMLGIRNEGDTTVDWLPGTRLGQLVLLPSWAGTIEQVSTLPDHERGLNGYGSSGR